MATQPRTSDAITIPKSAVQRAAIIAGAIAALIVIAVLAVALARSTSGSKDSLASAINPNKYQAVFLNNGQVYFGKLTAPGGDFYYLRHVYYLQSQASRRGIASQSKLIKLTTDINAPEDLMVINRSDILFVENLNPAGRAAQLLAHSP
jgi:hypothetical protein